MNLFHYTTLLKLLLLSIVLGGLLINTDHIELFLRYVLIVVYQLARQSLKKYSLLLFCARISLSCG